MIDKAQLINQIRTEIRKRGMTPHPRSAVPNTAAMGRIIDMVSAKLVASGHKEEEVGAAMYICLKHLCAAKRGYDEEANYIFDKYISEPPSWGEWPAWAQDSDQSSSGSGEGESQRDGSGSDGSDKGDSQGDDSDGDGEDGDGDGEDGDGDGDGEDGDGDGDGDSDSDGEDGDDDSSGSDGEDEDEDDDDDGSDGDDGDDEGDDGSDDGGEDSSDSDGEDKTQGSDSSDDMGEDDSDTPDDPDYEPPAVWNQLIHIIRWNLAHPGETKNVMLVGPKGIGKTKMVFELSEMFFHKMPYAITAPQMDFRISGYKDAFGREVKTAVTKGYTDEGGAIILIDEIDRMDAGAGIALNMATANKAMDTPSGTVQQAPNVMFIATANTSGTGATNDYNTANQLDASTRDRWIYLLVQWDHRVALKVAKGDETLVKGLEDWNNACDKVQYTSGQLSYRTIIDILDLMDMGCFTFEECIQAAMLKYAIPKSNLQSIYDQMADHYNKVAKAVKVIMDRMPDNDALF